MSIAVSIVEDDAGVRSSLRQIDQQFARLPLRQPACHGGKCAGRNPQIETRRDADGHQPARPQRRGMRAPAQAANCPARKSSCSRCIKTRSNIFKALAAGATGYMLKQTPPAELLAAIRDVNAGGSPMSGHIARKIVQSFQQRRCAIARRRAAFAARGRGAGPAGEGISLQGNRRPDENDLRHGSYPHPPHL